MSIFRPPSKPRRFHHIMIYSDERRKRLKEIEQQARRELGMEADPQPPEERLKGVFTQQSQRLKQRRKASWMYHPTFLILAIIILAAIWILLQYGA